MEGPELGIPLEPPRHVLWQRAALTVIEEHPYEMIAGGIMAIIFVAALVPHFVRRQLPEKANNIPVDVHSDGDESVYADTREVKQEQPSDEEGSSSSGLYSIPAKRSQSVRYRVITPHQDPTWQGYHSPPMTSSPPEEPRGLPPKTPRAPRTRQSTSGLQPITPAPHQRKTTTATPQTPMRMVSVELESRTIPNSPYIRVESPEESPTMLAPGDLVWRPRPARYVHPGTVDDDAYDGPFIVASTSNPAPKHLQKLSGAALASWALLELPENSKAERWYMENSLLRYTGNVTAAQLRRYAEAVDDMYVIDKIRNERVVRRKKEYKVAWKGYPCEDDTWEPEKKVKNVALDLVEEYESLKKQ